MTRACLMGARGNSGVILSQLVRGAAEALSDDGPVETATLARALRGAADAGYAAVREPQEGTILTVARELAEHAESLPPDMPLPDALASVLAHGEEALAATREQLDVLREAGVVDAGGAGLLELVRGITAHVRGEPLPELPAVERALPLEALHLELSRYRYCTSFYVEGENVDPTRLERELGAFGDSLLVVGAPGAVKVHFHTDEPGRALSLGSAVGVLDEVDIKNMHVQTAAAGDARVAAAAGEPESRTAVVAVCAGAGNERLFRSLGAAVIVEGGQTMNPSTEQLAAAIEAAPGEEVVVLPNNRNVVLAAEQAAGASAKPARVVPTETMQSGLAALVAFDRDASGEDNAAAMGEAAERGPRRRRHGCVTGRVGGRRRGARGRVPRSRRGHGGRDGIRARAGRAARFSTVCSPTRRTC